MTEEEARKLISDNLSKVIIDSLTPCRTIVDDAKIERTFLELWGNIWANNKMHCEKHEVEVSCDADRGVKASIAFHNPSPFLRKLIEGSKR